MNKIVKPDKSWTLFLDRDGIINKRLFNDYVKNIEQFEFIDGVLECLNKLSQIFGKIIIVTNQQGIGKGFMSEKELHDIHNHMCDKIRKSGGRIDKIYYCPDLHHSGSKNRKPEIGMGIKAKKDFPEIDFGKSIMIGDNVTDIIFGNKLNMFTVLVYKDRDFWHIYNEVIWDLHFSSLAEFTDWIMRKDFDE